MRGKQLKQLLLFTDSVPRAVFHHNSLAASHNIGIENRYLFLLRANNSKIFVWCKQIFKNKCAKLRHSCIDWFQLNFSIVTKHTQSQSFHVRHVSSKKNRVSVKSHRMNLRFFLFVNLLLLFFFSTSFSSVFTKSVVSLWIKTQNIGFLSDDGDQRNFKMENCRFHNWRALNPCKCDFDCCLCHSNGAILGQISFLWYTWWASLRSFICVINSPVKCLSPQ